MLIIQSLGHVLYLKPIIPGIAQENIWGFCVSIYLIAICLVSYALRIRQDKQVEKHPDTVAPYRTVSVYSQNPFFWNSLQDYHRMSNTVSYRF